MSLAFSSRSLVLGATTALPALLALGALAGGWTGLAGLAIAAAAIGGGVAAIRLAQDERRPVAEDTADPTSGAGDVSRLTEGQLRL